MFGHGKAILMGKKKKYNVGGLHWLLEYPDVICVPTGNYYGEFRLPLIAPSHLELDPDIIAIRTWNRKKLYGIIPYTHILGVSAGVFTKSSNLYIRNCALSAGENNHGLLPPDANVDELLEMGRVQEPSQDDDSQVSTLRIFYRDRGEKYLRMFIACEINPDNPGDYVGFAELLKERVAAAQADDSPEAMPQAAPKHARHLGEEGDPDGIPSLADVARWADAYGYLLVPKAGAPQP